MGGRMKKSEAIAMLSEKLQKQEHLIIGYLNKAITLRSLMDSLAMTAMDFCEQKIDMVHCTVEDLGEFGRLKVIKGWTPENSDHCVFIEKKRRSK
jgi:hypothetical protein